MAPHKFAPHIWKPKHCKICFRTLEEHDTDSDTSQSARAPFAQDPAALTHNKMAIHPPINDAGFGAANALQASRMSLNLDALRQYALRMSVLSGRNNVRLWTNQHQNFYNSLSSATLQLPFVEKFQLDSVIRNYKNVCPPLPSALIMSQDVTLVAHISLKSNFTKHDDVTLAEKSAIVMTCFADW